MRWQIGRCRSTSLQEGFIGSRYDRSSNCNDEFNDSGAELNERVERPVETIEHLDSSQQHLSRESSRYYRGHLRSIFTRK